ncbi:MAG: tetratricopeptide repeat protein, partial [Acidobacteriota bacterium]|nr:tetratricopeptide repeat protein [Acidobacteriota bacterium]
EFILMGHFVKIPETLFNYRIVKPKSAADFQADFNSEKCRLPPTPAPYTGLAAALLEIVWQSPLPLDAKIAVFADFIRTMSAPAIGWRQAITQELTGSSSPLSDAAFAFLLGQILARVVPLSEISVNPLLRAIYSPLPAVPDVLSIAGTVLTSRAATRYSATERRQKAALLFERGELEEASRLFAEALKTEETSDLWVNWATTQIARNRAGEAESGLRRALLLDPGHLQAALKLGILLAHLGRYDDAVPLLERSLRTLPASGRGEVERLAEACRAKTQLAAGFHPNLDQ